MNKTTKKMKKRRQMMNKGLTPTAQRCNPVVRPLLALLLSMALAVMMSAPANVFAESVRAIAPDRLQEATPVAPNGVSTEDSTPAEDIANKMEEEFTNNPTEEATNAPAEEATNEATESATTEPEQKPAKESKKTKKVKGASGISLLATTDWYYDHKSDLTYTLTRNEDMQGLALIVNSGIEDFEGKTVILGRDLTGLENPPIGTKDDPFAGTFDGGGKTITNLKISPQTKTHIGLFGRTAAGSLIKDLDLSAGTLSVSEDSTSGSQIRYVGGIAGYAGGDIEDCSSSMDVKVSSDLELDGKKHMGIIRNVGGIAGYIRGDMKRCTNSGDIRLSSTSNTSGDVLWLAGEIGGLSGAQGDVDDPAKLPVTEDCVNHGDFIFDFSGKGGKDRFGQETYPISFAAGGIVGQAAGIVRGCKNNGDLNTSNVDADGEPVAGLGVNRTGGIVGDLRGNSFETSNDNSVGNTSDKGPAYKYYISRGGLEAAPASYPSPAGIYNCANTGDVVGLAAVGGVVGSSGTFTEIEGSSNTGDVKGCRWNKPFAAGIGGNVQSDVRYCFNRGDIYSVSGGGYYCSGLVGSLWTVNDSSTPENGRVPVVEMAGCYTAGTIYTLAAGYRTAFLAGENDGYIHDNAYSMDANDSNVVFADSGTTVNNSKLNRTDLKSSKGVGLLNNYAASALQWRIFYTLDLDAKNGGYPVLSHETAGGYPVSHGSAVDIEEYYNEHNRKFYEFGDTSGFAVPMFIKLTSNAVYSLTTDPVPYITITNGEGIFYKGLVQNADFYVDPVAGTKGTVPGETTYGAVLRGMGAYKGAFSQPVPYKIVKAKISNCTILAASTTFNWEPQEPEWVKLIDPSGSEVKESEYTWRTRYDPSVSPYNGITTRPSPTSGLVTNYYDYTYPQYTEFKFDIVASAKDDSLCYEGATTQAAFRIQPKSLARMSEADASATAVQYETLRWGDEEWDFDKALADTTGGYVRILYTGQPIRPTVKKISYLGRELDRVFAYATHDRWYSGGYDIMYVYGNPNAGESTRSTDPVDVTPPDEPACMTVRYTPNRCGFTNFVNVFFTIVPANIVAAKAAPVADRAYTGEALTPGVSLTYNGMTLKEGTDYTLAYEDNTAPGRARITVKGKGNYGGAKTLTFTITGSVPAVAAPPSEDSRESAPGDVAVVAASIEAAQAEPLQVQVYTGEALTPAVSLSYGGAALREGADYALAYKDNLAPGRAEVAVTGLNGFSGTRTLYFDISPAKARLGKLTPGKGRLTLAVERPEAAQKATGLELRYRVKGTSKWRTADLSAKKSSHVVKGLKKGKKYQLQLRVVRVIKSGPSKGTYNGAWSATKTSKAIK
jgi:hypothetical protein